MAQCQNVLGGNLRGRIGAKTLYVRNGQQIIYERSGRKRAYIDKRHAELTAAMILAQRWKSELSEKGIDVSLGTLLRWANAITNAASARQSRIIADTERGGWAPSLVRVVSEGVQQRMVYHIPGGGTTGWQTYGAPLIGYGGNYQSTHIMDNVVNVYPSGSLFLSIIGDDFLTLAMNIAQRVNYNGTINYTITNSPSGPIYSGNNYGGQVWLAHPRSNPGTYEGRVYSIANWKQPLVTLEGTTMFPYAIITADGDVLEMAAMVAT